MSVVGGSRYGDPVSAPSTVPDGLVHAPDPLRSVLAVRFEHGPQVTNVKRPVGAGALRFIWKLKPSQQTLFGQVAPLSLEP